jgi:4-hydroxybenzoate polyprenyltransferase
MKAIRILLEKIETATAPFWQWCAAFLGILAVRFLLDNFSSPTPSFPASPDAASVIHYALFFLGAFLSLAIILRIFIPDIARISKFLLFGFPIIWLSPLLDLIYSHGAGAAMTYVFAANANDLFYVFLHIGAAGPFNGLTPGLRVEIMAIFIGAALYIGIRTGNVIKAFLAGLLSYCALFIWMVIPGLVAIVASGRALTQPATLSYLISSFLSSHLLANFARPSIQFSPLLAAETAFNVGMSSVLYIIDFILVIFWTILYRRKLATSLGKNVRLGRIAYYYSLMAIGAFVAIQMEPAAAFTNWVDVLLFICLALAFFSAFMFAIGVNDLADVDTDRINRAERPLATNTLTASDAVSGNFFFFAWLVIGGFLCGYWAFFTILVFTAAYYIYSAPPLRFKRVPIIAPFLIALAGLSTTMAGFFFVDAQKIVADFPLQLFLLLIICLTLAVNIKDIKDIDGDRAHDVWTIPVLLGLERGKQVVGALLAAAFLAVPVILRSNILFIPSLIAAILGYSFATMRSYREWRIFVLYFAYAGVAGLLLLR